MDRLEPADDANNGLGEKNLPALVSESAFVPAFIAAGGERAGFAFIDFFTAQIRNRNTRAAYAVAVRAFCSWAEARGLTLATLRTHHVAAYVELLGKHYSPPTVKQHLAAVRMLFDWLVVRQVIEMNPAAAVRGPKHVVKRGKTPVLEADEARQLLGEHRRVDPGRAARPRADRPADLYLRPRLGGDRHERRGLLRRRVAARGCGCTRKAASSTTCRRTTCSKATWTSI